MKADWAVISSSNAVPDIKRILIIKLADHGDAILATSAISAVRARFPNAVLDVLTTSNGAVAFALCPVIDHIRVIDKHAFDNPRGMLHPVNALRIVNLVRRLRRSRYDTIVLLQHLTTNFGALKYRWLCRGIGAPIRAGLDNGQGDFLTHRAVDFGFGVKSMHEYNLDVVSQLGVNIAHAHPAIAVPDDARRSAEKLLAENNVGAEYVVIHPSVGGYSSARNWPTERFAALAKNIIEKRGFTVVVVGANDAAEAARSICATANVVNLVGRTGYPELAALLDAARLVIGADSGVAHLAAALATPTLAIFGPSNHNAWKPIGATVLSGPIAKLPAGTAFVIRSDIPCSPCFYSGYTLGRRDGCSLRTCLDRLSVDLITNIAYQIINKTTLVKSTAIDLEH